jgi:hypothetical protein
MFSFAKKNNLHSLNKKAIPIQTYFTNAQAIQKMIKRKKMKLVKHYIQSKIETNIGFFIENKVKEKNETIIVFPEKKSLLIMACHPDSLIKLETIIKNFLYFERLSQHIDIVVISSLDTIYAINVKNEIGDKCFQYFEVKNSAEKIDFGKYMHVIKSMSYTDYHSIIFTNDSYAMSNDIDFFMYKAITSDAEFYGYNDSTQRNYHYQSYLFCVKVHAMEKFINMYNINDPILRCHEDVVTNIELKMIQYFNTCDCYLKIGELFVNRNKNIFFTSDYLYYKLKDSGLLPFTKIKRII